MARGGGGPGGTVTGPLMITAAHGTGLGRISSWESELSLASNDIDQEWDDRWTIVVVLASHGPVSFSMKNWNQVYNLLDVNNNNVHSKTINVY